MSLGLQARNYTLLYLTLNERALKLLPFHGAVAQLGERMNGIHEVEGSNPFGSTRIFLPILSRLYLYRMILHGV